MQDEMKPQAAVVDHSEAQMARADLYRGAKNAMKLFQMVQDGQQLEGWVQAKITKAADYLDSVYHYMEYQVKFGQGGVATSLDDITSDAAVMSKAGEVSEEDDEQQKMDESMNYEQQLHALLEGAKQKAIMKKKMDKKVAEAATVKYDKDGKRIGVVNKDTRKYSDEPHAEPASKVKAQSAADKAADKARDKADAKDSKDYEKAHGKGSVTRVKDGKKVSEGKKCNESAKGKMCEVHGMKSCESMTEASKPDFLDMDKDGDKKEPMKKAVADKKAGPKKGVNPFAKKSAAPSKPGMSSKQAKYFGKKDESVIATAPVLAESADLTRLKVLTKKLLG